MKYKALLSDLDKTLIHDKLVVEEVVKIVSTYLSLSKEKAADVVEDFYAIQTSRAHFLNGYTKVGAWKQVLNQHAITYSPNILCELNNFFWITASEFARPYPGVIETLQFLKENHIKIGIVSGGDYLTRVQHLQKTGILPFIDTLTTTEEIGNVKHKENLYAHGAKELGVAPHETIVVGDNEVADIILPKKDGFFTVKIGKPNGLSHAHVVIPTFAAIKEVFLNPLQRAQP